MSTYTEKEAKQKWCPAARAVEMDEYADEPIEGFPVGNRSSQGHMHPMTRCMGSACMWWRWQSFARETIVTYNLTPDQETMQARLKSHPDELCMWQQPEGEPLRPPGVGWVAEGDMFHPRGFAHGVFAQRWSRERPDDRRYGYCGMAGRPE